MGRRPALVSPALTLDRFVRDGERHWRDLATGGRVRVRRVAHAVGMTARPPKPGLVDDGPEGTARWVEVYDLEKGPLAGWGTGAPDEPPGALLDDLAEFLDLSDGDALRVLPVRVPTGAGAAAWISRIARHARLRGVVPLSSWWSGEQGRRLGWPILLRLLRHRRALVLPDCRSGSLGHQRGELSRFLCDLCAEARVRAVVLVADGAASAHASGSACFRTAPVLACVAERAQSFGAPPAGPAFPLGVLDSVFAVAWRAEECAGRGRHADARRQLERAIGERRRRGDTQGVAALMLALCRMWRLRGGIQDAERAARKARELFSGARSTRGVLASLLHLAWLALEDDRLDECAQMLQVAEEAAGRAADVEAHRLSVWIGAHLACVSGRVDDARIQVARIDGWRQAGPVAAVAESADGGPLAFTSDADRVLLPSPGADILAGLVRRQIAWACGAGGPSHDWPKAAAALRSPVDRATAREADILALSSIGEWQAAADALARGAEQARAAHAPLLALSLRLAHAECWRRNHGRQLDASLAVPLRRWERAALPGLFRRRLGAVLSPGDARTTNSCANAAGPPAQAAAPSAAGAWSMMEAFNEAADERSAVERACDDVRVRLGASAVTVFARHGDQTVALANVGRRSCDAAAAARSLGAEPGTVVRDTMSSEAFWPVRLAGETTGVVGVRWVGECGGGEAAVSGLLRALALTIALSVRSLRDDTPECAPAGPTGDILGASESVAGLRALVLRAATTGFPVLIQGESGTGKELTARAIHGSSPRRSRRFCAVNCAALTDDLVEAELFGHARGAFTGAMADRPGLFEEADGGTLFLDEVSELSPRAQAKLLRAIQEREIRRVGENGARKVDVRIVAATNRPLADECVRGRFRQDLFYRLDVVRIEVPSLRSRPEDIRPLAERFWKEAMAQTGGRAVLSPEALAVLARRPWPGNVRELQNTLAALAVRAPRHGRVGARDLALLNPADGAGADDVLNLEAARRRFEIDFVREALARSGGQRSLAARELGVTRQGLAKLLTRLGIC